MYHKIILEDILRVYTALARTEGTGDDARVLLPAIRRMAEALSSISRGFQRTPLFNDAGDNVTKPTESLLRAVWEVTGCAVSCDRRAFEEAGYYKLYAGSNALLFDCGQIGPSYMGGHAHCDCLSFELSRKEKLLFTNSGTYQYTGDLRQFFRSTGAHNTIMIDEREQSELWGEHRAARRISGIKHRIGNHYAAGQFRSYHGDIFRRKINLTENEVRIMDCVMAKGRKKHVARQFFHIAPRCRYVKDNGQQFSVWDASGRLAVIRIPDGSRGLIHREGKLSSFASDFGKLEHKEVLEIRTSFENRTAVRIIINLS